VKTPRIISIRQPWAWAITSGDIPADLRKDLENRNWKTNYRGPLLVHASLKPDRRIPEVVSFLEMATGLELPAPADLPLGGIVGRTNLVDVVSKSKSHWFFGRYGFVLRDSKPLPFIPCKGQLGIYYPDSELLVALRKKGIIR
jgi:hypothetical protein